jgi:hypothetical protein
MSTSRDGETVERTWHDPIERDGPCPECNVPWPCAERTRQREDMKWIWKLLGDALYVVTRPRPSIGEQVAERAEAITVGGNTDWCYGDPDYPLSDSGEGLALGPVQLLYTFPGAKEANHAE